MKETPPFGAEALAAEWPVLLECASVTPRSERLRRLLASSVDWSVLLVLADEHGVLGLLDRQLHLIGTPAVPGALLKKLQDRRRAQLFFTLSMTSEMFRLLDALSAAAIESVVVKGPVLSVQAYGDAGIRQYADVDLLVRHTQIQHAAEVMIAAGYQPDVPICAIAAGRIPGEYVFTRPDTRLLFELHTERTFRYFPRPLPLEQFFQRKISLHLDAHDVPALAVEDELVLACIHGAKHFWERLMWIADVAALVARRNLRWAHVHATARGVGAERMLHTGLLLARELVGCELPVDAAPAVCNDRGAARLAAEIRTWLPFAGYAPPGILKRAAFRAKMRGGFLAGPAYLLRLSLSPTEEDWLEGCGTRRPWWMDALVRPFRLFRKYGSDGKS